MPLNKPLVSIIMPVFNSADYLNEAIDSILEQTFKNFEFLIFNDGSTDKSLEIIKSYNDTRIRSFSSKVNNGYVIHLNKGIELAKGKYIARMDADDISLPTRLRDQVYFMENNSEIGMCGSWVEKIGIKNCLSKVSTEHEEIVMQQLFFPAFFHPSVMFRKTILKEYKIRYNTNFLYAEDYEIFVRLSNVTRLANIPKVLLKYRVHENSVTATKWDSHQSELVTLIRKRQIESFIGRKLNDIEIEFISEKMKINPVNIVIIHRLLKEMKIKNNSLCYFKSSIFNQFLNDRILGLIRKNFELKTTYLKGIVAFSILFSSVFYHKKIYQKIINKLTSSILNQSYNN
jgi:glycosyltransferase involved in cell wall biosynthesis